MHEARPMQISDTLQQLIGDVLALDGLKFFALLQRTGKVGLNELEDSVDVLDLLRHFPKDLVSRCSSFF